MKILFLSTWFPYPLDNGSKIRVYHLLQALSKRHRVTLLSFAFGTALPSGADTALSFCDAVNVVPRDPFERSRAIRVIRFASPSPIVNWRLPQMARLVDTTVAHSSFDAAIASTAAMAHYAHGRRLLATKILEEHNSMSRWSWERFQSQHPRLQSIRCWISYQKLRHYECHVFGRFDLCTMVSEQDRRAALDMLPGYRGPVEVVPNGVDCARNRPALFPVRPNTLVYNGALTYGANYDATRFFLSEIYPQIRDQVPDVSMVITGSTSNVDLAGLPLDGSVHLTGYVDDLRSIVGGSAACVVPIRQGGGTRLKILEAMALGTPVVATSKGAEGLDVRHEHDILIADEPDEFAAQVVRLLRDEGLRDNLARNARRLVEQRYDWAQIGQRFVDLVEQAVFAHSRTGARS